MTRRRIVPLTLATLATIAVACTSAVEPSYFPYGFVTVSALKSATGYAASPVGTFYNVNGLSSPTGVSPWDSCRVQAYSPSTAVGLGDVFSALDAGAAVVVTLHGRTDSLYPVVVGRETLYKLRTLASVPYTPGDSLSVVIPGTSAGYPGISFKAKTAEAVTVTDFATPPPSTKLDLRWTPSQDQNSTMTFTFRYGALGADTLNTQLICQYRDDGIDSVPARLISPWATANRKDWVAARLRTYVSQVAKSGYFEFISSFDVPMPLAP